MKYSAGIITYNPDIELFEKCLNSIREVCDRIIIVDNHSDNQDGILHLLKPSDTVILNADNFGVAKALNQMFESARDNGTEWLLTLDQDTVVPPNIIRDYSLAIESDDKIAIVCPRINDVISHNVWPSFPSDQDFLYVNRCITSGSFTNVRTWNDIGGFDNDLFIDEVDHDFCLRTIQNNYKICTVRHVVIDHKIGNTVIYSIFGKKLYVRNHSYKRKYYICRNILYISKKHEGRITFHAWAHVMGFIAKTLIFENDKIRKFSYSIKGIIDAIR